MTRVLIVDDDLEQLSALSRAFSELSPGLAVSTAGSGLAAIRFLGESSVDLLLTDLRLPDMDGFELLAWVLENRPRVSLVVMSAQGSAETDARLRELGASGCLTKPLEAQSVVSCVTDALSQFVCGQVHNLSLASFLQLLDMERKSCRLTVTCDDHAGVLEVRKGVLVAAHNGELHGDAAAIAIAAWPSPSITISRSKALDTPNIQASLGFILMEAMRLQDERARCDGNGAGATSVWPPPMRSWRPHGVPQEGLLTFESNGPAQGELQLPNGARGLALVETESGIILASTARDDCPIGELARMASQLLLQETATLRACSETEGVEELVLSTSSRCDLIRPLGSNEFALLIFAPEETNLVIARIELEHFIATHRSLWQRDAQRTP